MKLRCIGPRVLALDTRRARPAPKQKDAIYYTPEFDRWRAAVVARAGGRCQAQGCARTERDGRMYADHIVELKDGGAAFDVANGQCLCAVHHGLKTAAERAKRMAR